MGTSAVKALEATADADFYATSLRKPAELAIKAARGPNWWHQKWNQSRESTF